MRLWPDFDIDFLVVHQPAGSDDSRKDLDEPEELSKGFSGDCSERRMILVIPRRGHQIDRILERTRDLEPTYTDRGANLMDIPPPGFTHDHYERNLGIGAEFFKLAKEGLMSWRAHDQPGTHIFPAEASIRPGATVVVALGVGIAIAAPCRVIKVIDEPRSWGFSYATLPGHPEKGEESFIISSLDDGTVQFAIEAVSRPSDPLVRLVSPISRYVQRRASEGYLDSLQRYVDRSISL